MADSLVRSVLVPAIRSSSSHCGFCYISRLQGLHEVAHLANVIVHVRETNEEEAEPCLDRHIVLDRDHIAFVIKLMQRAHDHRHGFVELSQQHVHGRMGRIREFLLTLADVAAAGDRGPDVVVEVAGQVQDQVAHAVAEGKRFRPERLGGDGADEMVDALGQMLRSSGRIRPRSAGQGRTWVWIPS